MSIHNCLCCGKSNPIFWCGECNKAYYCSPFCQKLDWYSHKNDCQYVTPNSGIVGDIQEEIKMFLVNESFTNVICRLYDMWESRCNAVKIELMEIFTPMRSDTHYLCTLTPHNMDDTKINGEILLLFSIELPKRTLHTQSRINKKIIDNHPIVLSDNDKFQCFVSNNVDKSKNTCNYLVGGTYL